MEEELKHDSQFLVGHKINRPPPENAQILSATQHDPSACAICKRSRKEQVPAMRQCWLKPRSGTVPAGIGINDAFSSRKEKILGVKLNVSEGRREGFSDTNKKTNYRTRHETARRI
jgi:hypothetical protein